MAGRVIYVVRSWPRLSQTFVLNEILSLERLGVDLVVFALARSGESLVQPGVARVRAQVVAMDPAGPRRSLARARATLTLLRRAPLRFVRTTWFALRNPGLAEGYGECSTLACLGHAVDAAARLARGGPVLDHGSHVHAHFAHDPALVGLLLARLTGVGFTFTAHAKDLYQIPPHSLAARARAARSVVTCCAANADYIRRSVPASDLPPLLVVHHGVDLHRFARAPGPPAPATGVRLLSVGRLVEKKGFTDLLRALALLRDRDVPFTVQVCGEGPLHGSLVQLRDRLGLAGSVDFVGPRTQEQVTAAMAEADVFVLTPLVTDDGDRDGIPNVLVEAMASALPVTTTAVGGIPELVADGVNGRLLPEGDVAGVADALQQLVEDPLLRARLGAAGRRTVEECYDVDVAACRLRAVFAGRLPGPLGVVA